MLTTSKYVNMGNTDDGKQITYIEGECLSTDTKPTENIYNGSKIMEMDTATLYMFDAESSEWIAWRRS